MTDIDIKESPDGKRCNGNRIFLQSSWLPYLNHAKAAKSFASWLHMHELLVNLVYVDQTMLRFDVSNNQLSIFKLNIIYHKDE
ncbi:MAG: hypothetical protein ACTS7E_00505 [Arsenophonus sp. NC-CH8-MAG3]